jgi:transposase-like protein
MPKSATAVDPMVKPDPNLEKRVRRVFTGDYKLSIIQQADACKHGELGALLRREKLYAGQLLQWRREMAEHGVQGLSKSSPGPAPRRSTEDKRIEQLERENARLRRQLEVKDSCLSLQKKALDLLQAFEKSGS